MTATQATDIAIIAALVQLSRPATEREIEAHPGVMAACRRAQLKARKRLRELQRTGRVKWDQAVQRPRFWV